MAQKDDKADFSSTPQSSGNARPDGDGAARGSSEGSSNDKHPHAPLEGQAATLPTNSNLSGTMAKLQELLRWPKQRWLALFCQLQRAPDAQNTVWDQHGVTHPVLRSQMLKEWSRRVAGSAELQQDYARLCGRAWDRTGQQISANSAPSRPVEEPAVAPGQNQQHNFVRQLVGPGRAPIPPSPAQDRTFVPNEMITGSQGAQTTTPNAASISSDVVRTPASPRGPSQTQAATPAQAEVQPSSDENAVAMEMTAWPVDSWARFYTQLQLAESSAQLVWEAAGLPAEPLQEQVKQSWQRRLDAAPSERAAFDRAVTRELARTRRLERLARS